MTGAGWKELKEEARGAGDGMEPNETPEQLAFLEQKCAEAGIDINQVRYFWKKDEEASIFVKRPDDAKTGVSYFDVRDEIIEQMKAYAPKYKRHAFKPGEHLFVVGSCDFHISKLAHVEETGAEYNSEIAIKKIRHGISELARKASVFGIDRILFIMGSDGLHTDNTISTTTSGTFQDSDSMWHRAFSNAKAMYIGIIEELSLIAPVSLVFNPGNHDRAFGWMLTDSVASWFRNNPNVDIGEMGKSVSVSPRKYHMFGVNLIGTCHGDCREKDLSMTMATEASEAWGKTKYRYWITGDKHHTSTNVYSKNGVKNIAKEAIGVTVLKTSDEVDPTRSVYVNIVKSVSSPDSWHSRSLYISETGIEGFVFHERDGQVCRLTQHV